MTSLAKRKQKVNELRKAHFPFGFENNQQATSQYRQQYLEHPLQQPPSVPYKNSHFTIGSDQPEMAKNSYQSQFKTKFTGHSVQPRGQQKPNNDANNIVLGFDGGKGITNYRDEFPAKEADRGKQVNQRIVSVDLGDTLTNFATSYNSSYDGAQAPRTEKIDNNSGPTNLILGYDKGAFVTSSQAELGPKAISANNRVQRSYEGNVVFGGDGNNYHSEQRSQFAHKESGYSKVDKDRVLDFKSAHFQFAFPENPGCNMSQAQTNYNAKPLQKVEIMGKKPTNVQLKFDNNNYYNSSYADHYQQKPMSKVEPLNKQGRSTNVIIGMGGQKYNSQAKDQFVAKAFDRVKGKGAQGSIELGDGTREFSTHYRDVHNDKSGGQLVRLGRDQIDKKRVQNFVVGFTDTNYNLHSMDYGKGKRQTNRLTRQAIDKMRGTNIVYGNNEFQGKTIHTSSYGWKKNDDF